MKRASMSKWRKRIISGVLLMVMTLTLASTVVISSTAEETNTLPAVVYDDRTSEFNTWKKQTTKVAPVKEGYLFGGWYRDQEGNSALKSWDVDRHTGKAYAKFVPAYVLSVKVQWDYQVNSEDPKTALRILAGVDSLKYQSVGVQISLGNTNQQPIVKPTAQVYDAVRIGTDYKVKAEHTFGPAAKFYGVWPVRVNQANYDGQIYVRPYWVTQDGTTVYGMAKYFHTSDIWNDYITVPINKMPAQGGTDSAEAAGMVKVKYDPQEVSFIKVEDGRLFDVGEAAFDVVGDKNGTVTIIGNRKSVDPIKTKKDESVFANLVFKQNKPILTESNNEYVRSDYFEFTILDAKFCDWDENLTERNAENLLGVWDITY